MEYIGFNSVSSAKSYRWLHGGWVFVAEGEGDQRISIWFPHSTTPSVILTHRATHGLNGELVCGE